MGFLQTVSQQNELYFKCQVYLLLGPNWGYCTEINSLPNRRLVFEQTRVPGKKNSHSRVEKQQLKPHLIPILGIETRTHGCKASALATAQSLLPHAKFHGNMLKFESPQL